MNQKNDPYNYQFRRPRDNLTYNSYYAQESLNHFGNPYIFYNNRLMDNSYSSRITKYSPNYTDPYTSSNLNHYQTQSQNAQKRYQDFGSNTEKEMKRSHSNYSRSSRGSIDQKKEEGRTSILSTYGSNIIQGKNNPQVSKQVPRVFIKRNEIGHIYNKQQKEFDILNFNMRTKQPIRVYPNFTQEHILHNSELLHLK